VSEWREAAVSRLTEILPELRTSSARTFNVSWVEAPDDVAVAWFNATASEHWVLEVRARGWAESSMTTRAGNLARVEPVIRCRTLLGFAYAGLLAAFEDSYRLRELSRAGRVPGVDLVAGKCQRCGTEFEPLHPSGRKRREDAKWCDFCRRVENKEAHQRQRAASRQPRAG
jgi:hypothetical protein